MMAKAQDRYANAVNKNGERKHFKWKRKFGWT